MLFFPENSGNAPPALEKEKTLEMFQQIKLIVTTRQQKRSKTSTQTVSEAQQIISSEIEHAKLEDAVFAETGTELDVFDKSLAAHMQAGSEAMILRGNVEEFYLNAEAMLCPQ